MSDEFLTAEQAAARLQVSARTVNRLCEAGRLAAVDLGTGRKRQWRIAHSALEAILPRPRLLRGERPRGAASARPRPYKYQHVQPY